MVWLADYEAWGNTAKVIYNSVKINQLKVSQDELQPIRFQGQHFDTETGLHYNRFRYYDPDMGMFTTRDPIGLRGGDNVFQYAPNPTGFIDPLGLVTLDEAELSLRQSGVKPELDLGVTDRKGNKILTYSPSQRFERWFTLEKYDTSWLRELNDRKCPRNMNQCTGPMWEEIDRGLKAKALVKVFHKGATYDVRSTPTAGGHTNQCTYDGQGQLIVNQIPAAGTADYRACPNPPRCKAHNEHDVEPWQLAKRVGREADYYRVRPTIY